MPHRGTQPDRLPLVTPEGLQMPAGRGLIVLDDPAWFAWLAEAEAFEFASPGGSYTARRERRGDRAAYWRAAKKQGGQLRRAYLGLTENLTRERLIAVARQLLAAPPPTPEVRHGPRCPWRPCGPVTPCWRSSPPSSPVPPTRPRPC